MCPRRDRLKVEGDPHVQYPLAYIGNGRVTLAETYPVQPAESMAARCFSQQRRLM